MRASTSFRRQHIVSHLEKSHQKPSLSRSSKSLTPVTLHNIAWANGTEFNFGKLLPFRLSQRSSSDETFRMELRGKRTTEEDEKKNWKDKSLHNWRTMPYGEERKFNKEKSLLASQPPNHHPRYIVSVMREISTCAVISSLNDEAGAQRNWK